MMKKITKKKCKHDPVKFLTREHGDVWMCVKCKKTNKKVFNKEEKKVLLAFIETLREKHKNEGTKKNQ